jgi:DNA-binding NtrC family response regulator
VNNATTTAAEGDWLLDLAQAQGSSDGLTLVIAWSLSEPHRIGEVAFIPDLGVPLVLGRGSSLQNDGRGRIQFQRQRPWGVEPCPPMSAQGISREHIEFRPAGEFIEFRRLGRASVLRNGEVLDSGRVGVGDVLTVRNQLVLYVNRRPMRSETVVQFGSTSAVTFGEVDADGFVGESAAAWHLRIELSRVAQSNTHVLLLGESGVGKELCARAIHRMSTRWSGTFLARNAATLPESLIDAELFGHPKNYPNPGSLEREGLIGAAHGGTLFLDEIGEMPSTAQAHLLRVLDQEGAYHRLGEARQRISNFRFIGATNRPVEALKSDLAARLPVRVRVPGLADRREDIPLLCRHLLKEAARTTSFVRERYFACDAYGALFPRISPDFIEILLRYPYRTHVRELNELLWRSMQRGERNFLEPPADVSVPVQEDAPVTAEAQDECAVDPTPEQIRAALTSHDGMPSRAYAALGLPSRYALYRLLKRYGMKTKEEQSAPIN